MDPRDVPYHAHHVVHKGRRLNYVHNTCDDRRAVAKIFKSWVWDKLPEGSTIIDFPSLGTTYNGGWCSATKTR